MVLLRQERTGRGAVSVDGDEDEVVDDGAVEDVDGLVQASWLQATGRLPPRPSIGQEANTRLGLKASTSHLIPVVAKSHG